MTGLLENIGQVLPRPPGWGDDVCLLDPELQAALDLARKVRIDETCSDMRHKAVQRIEEDLLDIPEIAAAVDTDLAEMAKRHAATRKSYFRRFDKFRRWARERGFDEMPYPPAVAAAYFLDSAVRGAGLPSICLDRAAIERAHQDNHFAAPCADPLTRAVIAYLRTVLGGPDDGHRQAEAA